jgi:hypothetical protein
MNPLNVHRNRHGQQALPVFVANLDGNFAGIPLGQQIASDARGCLCGFSLRCIKVGNSTPSSSGTSLAPSRISK